nr:hypothetical protein Itr_chr05CG22640 [Ipomoea trifida]
MNKQTWPDEYSQWYPQILIKEMIKKLQLLYIETVSIYLPLSLDKKGKDSRKPMLSSSGLVETSAAVQMFFSLSARSDPEGFKKRQNGGELKKGERG